MRIEIKIKYSPPIACCFGQFRHGEKLNQVVWLGGERGTTNNKINICFVSGTKCSPDWERRINPRLHVDGLGQEQRDLLDKKHT